MALLHYNGARILYKKRVENIWLRVLRSHSYSDVVFFG